MKTHGLIAPYIDKQVSRAVKTGEPIMKPLFFNYPADQSGYTINDEWLLGDSLLAAPILSNGTTRDIHVPAGKWYDVAHRRVVAGPADLTGYAADLTQTPTFIRLGTPDTGMLMRAFDWAHHTRARPAGSPPTPRPRTAVPQQKTRPKPKVRPAPGMDAGTPRRKPLPPHEEPEPEKTNPRSPASDQPRPPARARAHPPPPPPPPPPPSP